MRNIKSKKIGRDVISLEIDALKKLKASINQSFDNVVKTILNCKNGKVITSGVGKSGYIAGKIAASFTEVIIYPLDVTACIVSRFSVIWGARGGV